MLSKFLIFIDGFDCREPWTFGVGVARTVLALGVLGTMLATPMETLSPRFESTPAYLCSGFSSFSSWCVIGSIGVELNRWVSISILVIVASGWRPRVTAIPFWWILVSNQISMTVIDGGDQVAAVLSLLLVFHSLTDRRRWHWEVAHESPAFASAHNDSFRKVVGNIALLALQIQVCFVYLNACLTKLSVPEWIDGTALYYWLRDPMFGPTGMLGDALRDVSVSPLPVVFLTWIPLLLEFMLGISIFLSPYWRTRLFIPGALFHLAIASIMGLWSFAFSMWAGLILMLVPRELGPVVRRLVGTWGWGKRVLAIIQNGINDPSPSPPKESS